MHLTYYITCIYLFLFIYDKKILAMPPIVGPFQGGALQNFRQQAQFGEGIRDWFVDMKDRIFGNSHSPELSTVVNQAKEDYERQKKIIEGFWLDLTRLSFDPDRDWGFHLGPWFIIKKSDDHINTYNANLPDPDYKTKDLSDTKWMQNDFGKDKWVTVPTPSAVTHLNRETTTQIIEDDSIIKNDVNESKQKSEKDNETYDHSTSDQSAKVILPK